MGSSPTVARDEIIGVPSDRAADIIGISSRRLDRWANSGLVTPSIVGRLGGRRHWSYSLEDIVQGCVVRSLEDDHGQHIRVVRRIVEALRTSTFGEPLSQLRWAVAEPEIYVGYPDDTWVGGKAPHQGVLPAVLPLEEIRVEARRKARERPRELAGHISTTREVLGNKPVFSGTRIPVASVLAYLDRGLSDDRILEAYPDLWPEDIRAARAQRAS